MKKIGTMTYGIDTTIIREFDKGEAIFSWGERKNKQNFKTTKGEGDGLGLV